MSRQRLASNALANIAQVIFSAVILFALYRFLMKQLSIEQIGVWSLVLASTAVGRLTDMGLGGGVVKFIAGDIGRGDRATAARTVGMTVVAMALFVGVACIVLYPVLYRVLANLVPTAGALQAARDLLPYALGALWIAALGNVFLSTLDGCQRMDLRTFVTISSAVLQLCAAYLIVPSRGLIAVGMIQVMQAAFVLVGGMLCAMLCLRQPPRAWIGWDRPRFRELFSYGGGFQVAALGQLFFEPAVKALLAKFGGLALTGYYEMASRIITQARAVVISAFQTLVPYVASSAKQQSELRPTYLQTYRLLLFLALPYYALLGAALPLILSAWRGGLYQSDFLTVSIFSLIGWAFNTMSGPAYFLYLGVGRLRWTIWTHVAIGSINVVLGGIAGWLLGAHGVLFGATTALSAGSMISVLAFHRECKISLWELLPRESIALMALCVCGAASILIAAVQLREAPDVLQILAISVTVFAVAIAFAMWRHPSRPVLTNLLRRALLPKICVGAAVK